MGRGIINRRRARSVQERERVLLQKVRASAAEMLECDGTTVCGSRAEGVQNDREEPKGTSGTGPASGEWLMRIAVE